MSDLTYTLLSDGSSDKALMPVLEWLLRTNGVGCAIQGQWADFRWLRQPPTGLSARLGAALDLYPCELLFIHRDAETEPYESRLDEVRRSVTEAFNNANFPLWVAVIPIRMQEARRLFDEAAIRKAAANPSGRASLQLPPLRRCEELADPKEVLHNLLREASELSPRRRARLPIGTMVRRITEFAQSFAPLRDLAAFAALERELREVIARNAWDRR